MHYRLSSAPISLDIQHFAQATAPRPQSVHMIRDMSPTQQCRLEARYSITEARYYSRPAVVVGALEGPLAPVRPMSMPVCAPPPPPKQQQQQQQQQRGEEATVLTLKRQETSLPAHSPTRLRGTAAAAASLGPGTPSPMKRLQSMITAMHLQVTNDELYY